MTPGAFNTPVKLGFLTSLGRTLDAFFPPIVDRLRARGFVVVAASGTHSDLAGSEWGNPPLWGIMN